MTHFLRLLFYATFHNTEGEVFEPYDHFLFAVEIPDCPADYDHAAFFLQRRVAEEVRDNWGRARSEANEEIRKAVIAGVDVDTDFDADLSSVALSLQLDKGSDLSDVDAKWIDHMCWGVLELQNSFWLDAPEYTSRLLDSLEVA